MFCFVSPFLKPYHQGCHDSELQLVTIGTWKCPRLCSPRFTTMNVIGPGNYGSETGQEMSQAHIEYFEISIPSFCQLYVDHVSHIHWLPLLDVFLFFCYYASFLCFHLHPTWNIQATLIHMAFDQCVYSSQFIYICLGRK